MVWLTADGKRKKRKTSCQCILTLSQKNRKLSTLKEAQITVRIRRNDSLTSHCDTGQYLQTPGHCAEQHERHENRSFSRARVNKAERVRSVNSNKYFTHCEYKGWHSCQFANQFLPEQRKDSLPKNKQDEDKLDNDFSSVLEWPFVARFLGMFQLSACFFSEWSTVGRPLWVYFDTSNKQFLPAPSFAWRVPDESQCQVSIDCTTLANPNSADFVLD